jgi:membrane protein YdbS with pleckstrin-like domain
MMGDTLRRWLLQLLRVPAEPAPPPGNPDVLQTFRASPAYLRYSLVAWALAQAGALAAIIFGYLMLRFARVNVGSFVLDFGLLEQIALAGFVAQLPFSYALVRLNFELRWYILSDRSLRIRHGILSVREQTMTFANIQNISIRQNPLQRIFGIASVVVRAAGGGSGAKQPGQQDSHEAMFEGVDNAEHIRHVIRERIRMHRDSGLGDPDERSALPAPVTPTAAPAPTLQPAIAAARGMLAEARLLREVRVDRSP